MTYPRVSLIRKVAVNAWREVSRLGAKLTPEMISRCGSETCWTGKEISPDGSLIAPLGSAPPTSAVCAEVALLVPYWLVAKTVTRMVWLTSEDVRRCVCPPPIDAQLLPDESQRSHW